MGLIRWRDDFETGVPLFDKEHRKMVQIIHDLFNAVKDKREDAFIKRIMEHFSQSGSTGEYLVTMA